MSTLRINNIEAQSVPASPTIDEKVKVTNSSGDILVNIDGKTSGITTIGINTTDGNIKFDANSNVLITGILTATTLAGNFTPDSLEIGSNIKLGNAGVITATSFVGSGANLTSLPAQATIANNADNRVITGGSGVNLNGEANVQIDSGGRLSVGNSQASTQYDQSNDLVIGNTTGSHGMTIISANDNRGRIMFSDTYSANTGRYAGQMLYDHQTETINWYSNYTNNAAVAMQLGGDQNQLFVGIDKGSTSTFNNRSAYFHRDPDNYISITGNGTVGIVFGDTIANNTGNYETYMHHTNSTNDFWIRVNQGNDNRYLKIRQSGNVEIGNGNLVLASGHGIDFSATSDGASVSNKSEILDDYEEGSFTPTMSVEGQGSNASLAIATGLYTKVGSMVNVWIEVQFNGTPSGRTTSNAWQFDGLPFTSQPYTVPPSGLRDYRFPMIAMNLDTSGTYGSNGHFVFRLFDNSSGGRIEWQHSDLTLKNASLFIQNTTMIQIHACYPDF